jgi:REP element-mobilizing transposase RayT
MANTFTQIHIHVVFGVQNRLSLIREEWRQALYKYIITIIQKHEHKVLAIGGMPDHVHILFGLRPIQSLSGLMQEVKRDSATWINKSDLVAGRFSWQEGYGAFSYSKSQIPSVINYIINQEQHHTKHTFFEEYKKILDDIGIAYDEQYLFAAV